MLAAGAAFWVFERVDENYACTAMGCSTGVMLDLKEVEGDLLRGSTFRVCADDYCKTIRIPRCEGGACRPHRNRLLALGYIGLETPHLEGESTTLLSLAVTRRGRTLFFDQLLAEVSKSQPNGASCGPTCFSAGAHYDKAAGQLVAGHR